MARSAFPYPGGKYNLAEWIISQIPTHHCYVEPFGGAAGVLLTKTESPVEIYNDSDGDVVQFFRVLREDRNDLVNWIRRVPYARSLHKKWASEFYAGKRPDDPIERAGRFFFLRHSQFASKYNGVSGWSVSSVRNEARKFHDATECLTELSDRLRTVQIEDRDHSALISAFDGADAFFYLDPPYAHAGDDLYRHNGEFDRNNLAEILEDVEGNWMLSLSATVSDEVLNGKTETDELIEAAEVREDDPLTVRTAKRDDRNLLWHDTTYTMRRGIDGWEKSRVECLLMNYDPTSTSTFIASDQMLLDSFDG